MRNVLIFSEKPSQALAYGKAFSIIERTKSHIVIDKCSIFPAGATITWGIGHLVELKMPGEYKEEWKTWNIDHLPIVPRKFEYKIKESTKDQFNKVKSLLKDCEKNKGLIINAVDQDREGANIFNSCLDLAGVKNVEIKRLWINSLEEDEIRKGFNNLQTNKKDLLMYDEARARQQADWLVGMNLSPLFSLSLKSFNGHLNIGRVLVPTTQLIYERHKEIENFVSKPFYEIYGTFNHEKGTYRGKADVKAFEKDEIEKIYKEYELQEETNGYIQSVVKKEKKELTPRLHSLSSLQIKANKMWKYSPSDTLKIVQVLYEKYKLVSYPRTDCHYITESEFNYLLSNVEDYQDLIKVKFEVNKNPNKRHVNNDKVEEHYALIPTKTIPTREKIESLNEKEKNIYYEILRTTLAMFHNDYVFEETTIITSVNDFKFKTTGKVEKNKGWKELFKKVKDKNDDVLPKVQENDESPCVIETKEKFTKPKSPYTEGELIKLMKTAGKFVENEEDSEILKEVEGIGTEATRSGIIEKIKQQKYITINKNIVSISNKGIILCEATGGTLLSSPSMTAKWESYLKKIGKGEGESTFFIDNIIKFINKMIEEVPEKLKDHKVIAEKIEEHQKKDGIVNCPSCESGQIVDKKTFYGCSGYADGCKVSFSKKIAKKTITQSNIKSLCTKRETSKLKGFKSKVDKSFEAKLILNDQNKIEFSFK